MRWIAMWMAALLGVGAQAQDAQLAKVLAQLDAASAKFESAQADFSWDQYTKVVDEHDVQTGNIAFRRSGSSTAMVAHVMTDDGQPAPKDVLYQGGVLKLWQPQIKQETILHTGARSSQFESFATLGFGGSGKALQENWTVSYEGTEMIDGKETAKLALAPKNQGPNPLFSQVEIWIDPSNATSLKQIFTTPGGDSRTATYTNIKPNNVPEKAFTLKVPNGVVPVER